MIPLCHNENALKRGKNQDLWLHFYIKDGIDSIPHCHTENALKTGKISNVCFVSIYTEQKKKLYTYLFSRISANTFPRNIIFLSNNSVFNLQ